MLRTFGSYFLFMKEVKKKESKATRKKISLSIKKYYSNPLARKSRSEMLKKRYSNPLARKKLSISMKKYFSNPIIKKKLSRKQKKYWQEHPEIIKKIDRTITKWWKEHPHLKKKMSIEAKKLFMKNPSKFSKFLKYGNNPSVPQFKTKQGFLVRSRGEQEIADFLFAHKIKSAYEGKTLIFKQEGQICIPDFWLPTFKIYIEFYGGYPKAWKKKVMKNRLYKAHKIPCIFITPSELRDLNYYLIGELKGKKF